MKKEIGIGLIVFSGLIALANLTITGAVVGMGSANGFIGFIITLIFLVGTAIVVFDFRRQVRVSTPSDISDIILEGNTDGTDGFVVDSSAAINYKERISELLDNFHGTIYVPKGIMSELKNNDMLMTKLDDFGKKRGKVKHISDKSQLTLDDYRFSRQTARDYLINTTKHLQYIQLKPYFEGKEKEYTKRLTPVVDRIKGFAQEKFGSSSKENCLKILEKKFKVSKGDINVLTIGVYNAYHGEKTKILANDSHIREATLRLRRDDPHLAEKLFYIDYDLGEV